MDSRKAEKSRSRSPRAHSHRHRRRSPDANGRHSSRRTEHKVLPYNARDLTKHDLLYYRPMFALFLDIQKRLDIEDLTDDEVRGRWKSFINKWNRGDLAEGWYDVNTLEKARKAAEENHGTEPETDLYAKPQPEPSRKDAQASISDDEEEDDYGPALPTDDQAVTKYSSSGSRAGPTIPTSDDIQSRAEDARISMDHARDQRLEAMRLARKTEQKVQKERLEEVAPRAEAGTRERQLEKKRELAGSNRAFASSKDVGGDFDVPESDVMGGDELSDLKRMKKEQDRRKTDREIKREEILRARQAEREERTQKMQAKEEKTMSMLRELARSRFGDGNAHSATLSDE